MSPPTKIKIDGDTYTVDGGTVDGVVVLFFLLWTSNAIMLYTRFETNVGSPWRGAGPSESTFSW